MNHLLFKTKVNSAGVQIELINTEDFEQAFKDFHGFLPDMTSMKFTYNLADLLQSAVETEFISTNSDTATQFDWISDLQTHINSFKPLFLKDNVVINPVVPASNPSSEELIYVFNHMVKHADEKNKLTVETRIRTLSDSYSAYGYVFDIEAILNPPEPTITEAVNNGNLKDYINKKYPCPDKKKGFYINPEVWYLCIRNVLKRENTLLVGPTGSGKTELVDHIAAAMGKPLFTQDMGTVQDAQSALLGVHRLDKDGKSSFDYAPFALNVQTSGIHLLDEMNRAPQAASNILFPCLDRRRYLPVDIADTDSKRHLDLHEDTVFFATANLGVEYSGTHAIDRALLDRFMPIELDYPSESDEVTILTARTKIDKKDAKSIVTVANKIRKEYKDQELSNAVSVRHTLLMANLVQDGFSIASAMTSTITPLFEDGVGSTERNKVKSIIAAF